MEFLVMPQTVHSLVGCYSAGGCDTDDCCYADGILTCNCKGDGATYEPCIKENTCPGKCIHTPVCGVKNSCIAKSCTIKAEIMNQP